MCQCSVPTGITVMVVARSRYWTLRSRVLGAGCCDCWGASVENVEKGVERGGGFITESSV